MENNIQEKKLYRSNTNRVIFGVCGGLGEYLKVDPILIRIIFILFTFGAGSGVFVYLILALLIPKDPSLSPTENKSESIDVKKRIHELADELRNLKRSRGGRGNSAPRLFLGFILLIIGFSFLIQNLNLFPGFYFDFSFLSYFWPVLLILLGLSILLKRAK
jgi:phage shock protein C